MKSKKQIITIIFLVGYFATMPFMMFGQEEPDFERLMAAPNTAELGKYGAIPVSKYTGIPSISIPFHEMDFEGLKIPVGISYHSGGGIQTMQEATWVGLGWSLTTNAAITRTIRQISDMEPTNTQYRGYVHTEPLPTSFTDSLMYYLCNHDQPSIDTEPDLFICNMFNTTIKFHLKKKAENGGIIGIKKLNQSNDIISYNQADNSFTVVNDMGFTFYFKTKEYASDIYASSEDAENEYTRSGSCDLQKTTTAWYLSSIKSPNGKILEFNYFSGNYLSVSQSNLTQSVSTSFCWDTLGNGFGGSLADLYNNKHNYSSHKSLQSNKYLEEIINNSSGESIVFSTSGREDLYNDTATTFDNFLYPDMNYKNPQKLDSIAVYNINGSKVKKIGFSYTYFNKHKLDSAYPEKQSFIRLKLDSITINKEQVYAFDYINPDSLPKKTSKDVDFWGFYNGANNTQRYPKISNAGYICESDLTGNTINSVSFDGANRGSNFSFGQNGLLNKITYPVKGYTDLIYESHQARIKVGAVKNDGTIDRTCDFFNTNISGNRRVLNFWLMEGKEFEYEVPLNLINGYFEIDLNDNKQFRIDNFFAEQGDEKTKKFKFYDKNNKNSVSTFEYLCTYNYPNFVFKPLGTYSPLRLHAGKTYVFEDVTDSSPVDSSIRSFYFEFYVLLPMSLSNEGGDSFIQGQVGGARIKSIINKNHDGTTINRKDYRYVDNFGKSQGILMNEINHLGIQYRRSNYYVVADYKLSSNSVLGVHNSANSYHIGYSMVDEIETNDSDTSQTNGFVRTYYHNYPNIHAAIANGPPIHYSIVNGNPIKEVVYSIGEGSVKTIDYDYHKKTIGVPTHAYKVYYVYRQWGSLGAKYKFIADCFPYYLKQEVNLPTGKTITMTSPGNSDVISTETYAYNGYNQLKEVATSQSNGIDIINENKYPLDYTGKAITPEINNLLNANIVSPVIEEVKCFDDGSGKKVLDAKYIKYSKFHDSLVLPAVVYKLNSNAPINYQGFDLSTTNPTIADSGFHGLFIEFGTDTFLQTSFSLTNKSNNQNATAKINLNFKMVDNQCYGHFVAELQGPVDKMYISYNIPGNIDPVTGDYIIHFSDSFALPQGDYIMTLGYYRAGTKACDWSGKFNMQVAVHESELVLHEKLIPEMYFDYDAYANLVQRHKPNDIPTAYFWGHNKTYPVIKAVNATSGELDSLAHGLYATYDMENVTSPSQDPDQLASLQGFVGALRQGLPNAKVFVYTYKPLVGITSSTGPEGIAVFYEYDSFGRLAKTKEIDLKTTNAYEYIYKPQNQ